MPDHVVVIGERHLLGILSKYVDYYNGTRTHLSLAKDAPEPRSVHAPSQGRWWRCHASVGSITNTSGGRRERLTNISGRHNPAEQPRLLGILGTPALAPISR
jgi:hypothetical protein